VAQVQIDSRLEWATVSADPGTDHELTLTFQLSESEFVAGARRGALRTPFFWPMVISREAIAIRWVLRGQTAA